jgi:hypothetical protein
LEITIFDFKKKEAILVGKSQFLLDGVWSKISIFIAKNNGYI